jgi:IclR family pca regulon transcriptional regulator
VERGLAILGCFTPSRPVLGIADLAGELEMSRSTIHRYVSTLVKLGYMEQVASRKYRMSLRVTDLGMSVMNETGLREHAHQCLEELSRRTKYTISLTILDWIEILYVDRVRSFSRQRDRIDLGLHPGSRLPAYCTAMGKVLLAYLPIDERDERIDEMTLTKRGPNTITSKKTLCTDLAGVCDEGFAVNDEEFASGLYSIAAPVRDEAHDVVAAASIASQTATISIDKLVDALIPHLVATADRISARLGYRRDDERYT